MQIFDKALVETTFTAMYAQFCSDLNQNLPEFEDPDSEDGKMLTFRRILLNKCQVPALSEVCLMNQRSEPPLHVPGASLPYGSSTHSTKIPFASCADKSCPACRPGVFPPV